MAPSFDFDLVLRGTVWVLLASGIVVLGWALFWDRSRGRRRCSRCWYDMKGVPGVVCPECGRKARHEGVLYRTRRSGRGVLAGAILLIAAAGAARFAEARAHGWQAAVPTTAILLSLRWLEPPTWQEQQNVRAGALVLPLPKRLYADLAERRIVQGRLWGWQRRWLIERCISGDGRHRRGSQSWSMAYVPILFKLAEAGHIGEALRLDPGCLDPAALQPINMGRREMRRIHEAFVQFSIITRPRWPLDLPLVVRLRPNGLQGAHPRHERELVVTSRLEGAAPIRMWLSQSSQLGEQPYVLAAGGRASRAVSNVVFDVEMSEVIWLKQWGSGESLRRDLLKTRIVHPVEFAGSATDILEGFRSEQIEAALSHSIAPVCQMSVLEPGMIALQLFEPDRWKHSRFAISDQEAVGLRLELMRNGVTVADGSAYIGSFASGGRWGSLMLAPRHGAVLEPVTNATWRLRLTGDANIALEDFEATKYWQGELEAPVRWLKAK
jgi:hypothetical protein